MTKIHRTSYIGPDDIILKGVRLTTILNEHMLWNESHHRRGNRAILKDADLTNLAINPKNDISEHFHVTSVFSSQQYLIETLIPKGPQSFDKMPEGPNLSGIVFENCCLNNTHLTWIKFDEAIFSGCSLRDATLAGSSFKHADLSKCNLSGSIVSGAKCDYACFRLSDMRGAWCRDTNLPYADMTNIIADDALFRGANGWSANFTGSSLQGAVFISGWFEHAIFCDCNLQRSNFGGAKVDGADFSLSDLRGSNIAPEQLRTAERIGNIKLHDYGKIQTPLPTVFLSYAWMDHDTVAAIDYWLRKQGIEVCRDERDFLAGDPLIGDIQTFIEKADVVVFFVSKNSKDRPYPRLELELARVLELESKGTKRLIYVCLDDIVIDSIQKIKVMIPAYKMTFLEVCNELWYGIIHTKKEPKHVNISPLINAGLKWIRGEKRMQLDE